MRLVSSFDIKSLVRPFLNKSSGFPASNVKTPRHGKYWSFPKAQCAICAENASFDLGLEQPPNLFPIQFNTAPGDGPLPSRGQAQVAVGADDDLLTYPIYTPYRASCGDLFCYHCLAERMMRAGEEKQLWKCVRCGESVRGAERLVIRSIEEEDLSGSVFELSDVDTDLSGSITSLSE
jgi:peroxin-2